MLPAPQKCENDKVHSMRAVNVSYLKGSIHYTGLESSKYHV